MLFMALFFTLIMLPIVIGVSDIMALEFAHTELQTGAEIAVLAAVNGEQDVYESFSYHTSPQCSLLGNTITPGIAYSGKEYHSDTTTAQAEQNGEYWLDANTAQMRFLTDTHVLDVNVEDGYVYPTGGTFTGANAQGLDGTYNMKIPQKTIDSKHYPTISVEVTATYNPPIPFPWFSNHVLTASDTAHAPWVGNATLVSQTNTYCTGFKASSTSKRSKSTGTQTSVSTTKTALPTTPTVSKTTSNPNTHPSTSSSKGTSIASKTSTTNKATSGLPSKTTTAGNSNTSSLLGKLSNMLKSLGQLFF